MKLTIFGLPLVLVAIGVSSTQAGLFDFDLAGKLGLRQDVQSADCGPTATEVGDCEPGKRRREVVKQPCVSPLHHYQRTMAQPLPPGSKGCAKPVKPIAECESEAELAAALQRDAAVTIARLIFQSQTGCYARERRSAIHALGDGYDCSQNPEILVAFVYALNDTDERVRAKAAAEIGDQIREHPDCAVPEIVAALKQALSDCDKRVRREARLALSDCGIDVVRVKDGSCARPAETCVPRKPSVSKAEPLVDPESSPSALVKETHLGLDSPALDFLQEVESQSEPLEVTDDEPLVNSTQRRGLSGLIEYIKERRERPSTAKLDGMISARRGLPELPWYLD